MNQQRKNRYELQNYTPHRALVGHTSNTERRCIGRKSVGTAAENGRYQRPALQELSPLNRWERGLNTVAFGLVAGFSGLVLLWFIQNLSMASADLQMIQYTTPNSMWEFPHLLQ